MLWQYLHDHRAGHGAVTSPSAQRGYTAFVPAKMPRLQGASGIHVGTLTEGSGRCHVRTLTCCFSCLSSTSVNVCEGVTGRREWDRTTDHYHVKVVLYR